MKIALVTLTRLSSDSFAGGELYLMDMIRGLLRERFAVYLVFPDLSGKAKLCVREYERSSEYREYVFDRGAIEDSFDEILTKFGIDIVHFQHFQTLPLSLMKRVKEAGRKLAITIHDFFLWCENFFLLSPIKDSVPSFCFFENDERFCSECLMHSEEVWRSVYGRPWSGIRFTPDYVRERRAQTGEILGLADLITTPTAFVRNTFLDLFPRVNADRYIVIEHGMDFAPRQPREPVDRGRRIKAAFLGEFKYEKGSRYFLELLRSFRDEAVEFSVIGNLKEPIRVNDFPNLTVTGEYRREELSDILMRERVDVILLLSPCPETYSYTFSEAIIHGIPVIATDMGAFRERMSRHGVGFLVPIENPVPRTAALLKDIVSDRRILNFFRKNCIDAAHSFGDTATSIKVYIDNFKKIAGPKNYE